MLLLVKPLLLACLVKILIETESPLLCASIYGGVHFLFRLSFTDFGLAVFLLPAVSFGLSFLYFWLLNRLGVATAWWWVVLIAGMSLGLV